MVGACEPDGTAKYTQTYKENKPGGCPSSAKAKFLACCYQKNDWRDTTVCNSIGRKTQQQTTAGNCPDNVKTKQVDCPFVGNWVSVTGCGIDGQEHFTRIVVNNSNVSTEVRPCCYPGVWSGWSDWSSCDGSKQTRTRTRIVSPNCPGDKEEKETKSCSIPISSYFNDMTCADLGGGSDVISASSLDDCMGKCKHNTHGYGYTCYGLIYGNSHNGRTPFCRVYNNKNLDHTTNICDIGLNTYVLK